MAAIELPDSRKLAFETLGDADGVPVVVLHGTPGSSRQLGCDVVGLSGGGPTALACAALPGDLVSVVATVGSVAREYMDCPCACGWSGRSGTET